MAEAALFSIFMKVLTWCQATSFGFKPSCFQVQGRAGLVSMPMAMACSTHSGHWAQQCVDPGQWGWEELRLGKGHSRSKRCRLNPQGDYAG